MKTELDVFAEPNDALTLYINSIEYHGLHCLRTRPAFVSKRSWHPYIPGQDHIEHSIRLHLHDLKDTTKEDIVQQSTDPVDQHFNSDGHQSALHGHGPVYVQARLCSLLPSPGFSSRARLGVYRGGHTESWCSLVTHLPMRLLIASAGQPALWPGSGHKNMACNAVHASRLCSSW